MKILMLTPYLPYPPNSGGQIRTYNLLRNLSREHSITLVSLYKNDAEKAHAETLRSFCKEVYLCKRPEKPWTFSNIFKAVFGVLPFLIVRNYSSEAASTVSKLLTNEKFDVIHAETFYVMPHIPKTNTPILLVEQTLEYRVYKHYISKLPWYLHHPLRLDTFKLKFWEEYYWNRAQMVAAVSQADADAIHMLSSKINPVVIPNGASDEMFTHEEKSQVSDSQSILFIGNFSWLQNTEAAQFLLEKITPYIFKKHKSLKLIIAGQNIPEDFKKYESNDQIKFVDLNNAQNSFVHKLYNDATVFVAPIYGPGGTRLKILSAMAAKTPVITTSTGAEGLYLTDKKSVLLAESEKEFTEKILTLIEDVGLRKEIAESAYQTAVEKFSWNSITLSLVEAYKNLINK
ncbi:MAG: glycosyltransferase family 4 protein [Patescibacteria group bacterium]